MTGIRAIRVPELRGKIRPLSNGEYAIHVTDPWIPPGAFVWFLDPAGDRYLRFVCPCGCGIIHMVRTYVSRESVPSIALGPLWIWNGNAVMPTLTPSLHMSRACGWHGFLTDGVFVSV
jgi:hypothetical protein